MLGYESITSHGVQVQLIAKALMFNSSEALFKYLGLHTLSTFSVTIDNVWRSTCTVTCCRSAVDVLQGSDEAGVMAASRYPRRNRNNTLRPESLQGSGQAASSSKDQEGEESGSEQVLQQLLHESHAVSLGLLCLSVLVTVLLQIQ